MMIGRLENMDIADDWRRQEAAKAKKERRFWIAALIISVATLIATYPHLSWADTTHFNVYDGRSEPAFCYVEYSFPQRTVCVSESFVCTTIEDLAQTVCTVKR